MSADMAIELKPHNVACVTLYPGAVLTEEMGHVLQQGVEVGKQKGYVWYSIHLISVSYSNAD